MPASDASLGLPPRIAPRRHVERHNFVKSPPQDDAAARKRPYGRLVPRVPRKVQLPDYCVVHAGARGVGRMKLVYDRDDALFFLATMADVVAKFDWVGHAFCLMTNHYHVLIEGTRTNLSRGFQRLNYAYARRFNDRHVRWGHVFGERFWSAPIQDEEHLAATALYIIHNPIRAGLCNDPREWPWLGSRYGLEAP